MQQNKHYPQPENNDLEDPIDLQPMMKEIWDYQVPKNFKPSPLARFVGNNDLWKHIITINTQMTIIGVIDALKCKLMADTLKDDALCWYMSLSKLFVTSYQDMAEK